jgi:uncharacterized membrane protein (UPF0136 family)
MTYRNPLNLAALAIGLIILVSGSYIEQLPDWDVGISLIMGVMTYFAAPFVIKSILTRKHLILAFVAYWITVDTSYVMYNSYLHHPFFRTENLIVSTLLFFIFGLIMKLGDMLRSSPAKPCY